MKYLNERNNFAKKYLKICFFQRVFEEIKKFKSLIKTLNRLTHTHTYISALAAMHH